MRIFKFRKLRSTISLRELRILFGPFSKVIDSFDKTENGVLKIFSFFLIQTKTAPTLTGFVTI